MKNLEQIRAASALKFSLQGQEIRGKDGGEAIKKIPPMIMINGLLASIAFSIEVKSDGKLSREGYAAIFDGIAKHLASEEINIIKATNAKKLIDELANSNSQILKLATAEALQWLSYARRFVTKDDNFKQN